MNRVLLLCWLVAWCCSWPASLFSAEASPREGEAIAEAERRARSEDWAGAGYQWEQAMSFAENAGEYDRAIAHGERALAAWRKKSGAMSQDRQAFALGVMSKLDLAQGRLTRGRDRNLEALRLIAGRIAETSGWQPSPGQAATARVPPGLLEAWARASCDSANWLDAQGRTVEAVELLTAVETSVRGDRPGQNVTGFYRRKVVSTRANLLKFLGFEERAISALGTLVETADAVNGPYEWAQRFNFAYYRSLFFGPKPEYLEVVRGVLRELNASGRNDRQARRLIAKMAYAYGEAGVDVSDLESVIAEARAAGADLEAIYAQRDLAVLGLQMGRREGVEDALRSALMELRRRGVKRGEPTLYREYGQFLVQDGRPAEGLQMLREAVRLTRAFGWTQHLPDLLANVAAAQAALRDRRGLEQTLADLDALLAGGALVREREFRAHCARARTLLLLGRVAEAGAAIARANALADQAGLNEFQRFALKWTQDLQPVKPAETPVVANAGTVAGSVDLQPVAVLATAEPGGTARARFRLSNTTAHAAEGALQVEGRNVSARLNQAASVATISAGMPGGAESANLSARIGPGDEMLIKIEAIVAETNGGIRLKWQDGGAAAQAVCHLQPLLANAEDEPGATVSNTSLAWENPFYAVPLHHPVRTVGDLRSFRVLPSQPCRVELLDARTGAILAVDADGDGAFRSAGDSVGSDADADGFPDLPADAATGLGEIEILVFPPAPASVADLRLEVQVKTTTGWKSVAHDILKAPRRR